MQIKQVLIKYGGNAMLNSDLQKEISLQIKKLYENNIQVILVHGGGPFINKALETAGIRSEFIDGHRHTSSEAIKHIETALKGTVNSSLVGDLNKTGLKAVGLSGKDGKMVTAIKRWHSPADGPGKIDLGQVGDVSAVDVKLINMLLEEGYIPVVASIASDEAGEEFNVNADMFAGHLAAALKVDEYIILSDVDGLYNNYPDPESIIASIRLEEITPLYKTIVKGGMIPKIESCEVALYGGVKKAVILNGTKPEQIQNHTLSREPLGTTIIS